MYKGDNSSGKETATPSQVEANLKENSITIQNTGNDMNSFTVFNDCAAKYIKLVKQ